MRQFLKISGYILGAILVLLILFIAILHTNWGQNQVRQKIVFYLNEKLSTEIAIGEIQYRLPNHIELQNIYLADEGNDTLLFVHELKLDWKAQNLIFNKLTVEDISINGLTANITRKKQDSTFNFQFIINAFSDTATSSNQVAQISEEEKNSESLIYDIQKISLSNINFRFGDTAGGNMISTSLDNAFLSLTLLNLNQNKYALNKLNITGLTTHVVTDTSYLPAETADTSASPNFQIAIKNFSFNQIDFSMLNCSDSMYLASQFDKLYGELKQFALKSQLIQTGKITLENMATIFVLGKEPKPLKPSEIIEKTPDTADWTVFADGIALNQISLSFDDPNAPIMKQGVDYSHLNLNRFFLNADSVYYSSDSTSANLKHLTFLEKSGLNLMALRTKFSYTKHGAVLDKLYLQTPNSLLQNHLAVHYPSLDAFIQNLNKGYVNIKLQESKIGINDILLFLPPEQKKQLLPYKNQYLKLIANAKGSLSQLKLNQLYLSGLSSTKIDIHGQLKDIGNLDKFYYTIQVKKIHTSQKDIAPFLPDSIKNIIEMPDWISVSGRIKGTALDYYPDLILKSADGNVSIKGKLLLSNSETLEQYNLSLKTQQLNLGKILKQDSVLGTLTASVQAQGQGFDLKAMNSNFQVHLQSANALNYNYHNITLNATVKNQNVKVNAQSKDDNLYFRLSAQSDLQHEYPSLDLALNLKNADLYALNLFEDTLTIAGDLRADFSELNPDYPKGKFYWLHPFINYNGKKVHPDSIYLISNPTLGNSQNIEINVGGLIHAFAKGHIPMSQLGEAISAHINRHFQFTDSITQQNINQTNFALKGSLKYQQFLKQLIPELQPFDSIPFSFQFNQDTLAFHLKFKKIIYADNKLDSGLLNITENKHQLNYLFSLKNVQTSFASIWYPKVGGIIRQDSVYAIINIDDSLKKKQFTVGGVYYQGNQLADSGMNYFSLFKGLRFNYEKWAVEPENKIAFGAKGFYIHNLRFSHKNQSVNINSKQPNPLSPIDFKIKNFSLANITKMFSKDTLLADGILNLQSTSSFANPEQPKINVDLSIHDLKIYNQPLGSLSVKLENKSTNNFAAALSLKGQGNYLSLNGNYFLKTQNNNDFNFKLKIQPLQLKALEGFAFGTIKNSSGNISGNLNIKGTFEKPVIIGQLNTHQLASNISMLNAYFKMPDETVLFKPFKIVFNQFNIEDKQGHNAILDGLIFTKNYTDYFLNLNFKADHWHALNSQKKDNPNYYGNLIFSANLDLKGIVNAPEIEGEIRIHDSTDLHYAMIDNGPGMVASDGIVEFVDSRDALLKQIDTAEKKSEKFHFSPTTKLNINVDVDKNATFTILIDPATGDRLQIKGDAALNAYIDPSGALGLTGIYKVNDGFYELNYNFLHRKFDIQDGSTVSLSGNPMNAEADITAVYNADIAPFDLVKNIVPEDQLVYYKQKMPFQVVLNLKGKIMKPEISFDIVLSDSKNNRATANVTNTVKARLNKIRNAPSDLNKQVFAVLILNKFLANNPFSSGNGVDIEQVAKKSVSRFLSDQLNRISGHLIKGFEVNFDLSSTEDYSTGSAVDQTNLNISASKALFNNRLKITVGNNFLVDGQNVPKGKNSTIPGNLSITYLITKDGRYQIGAYRTNELQSIVNGYVVEAGLKFKVTMSYNKFKSLFMSKKKRLKKQTYKIEDTSNQKKQ